MKTVKLFDLDAYIFNFTAQVLSCERDKKGYRVVLDRTAFFPEGGGQYGDRGVIAGVSVLDTQSEEGIIYHLTDAPIEVGKEVRASLDKDRRFNFMQNHTGEHIVSGLVHEKYGFDNVGFHLGEEFATLDFNGILNREQLDEIELAANGRVWENLNVRAYYPQIDELIKIDYRSKKELEGAVRIVEIENTDICACCAPHVQKTGEIGAIKLLETEKMRGGTRIVLKCGRFAALDYQDKFKNVSDIAVRLSVTPQKSAEAVAGLEEKLRAEKIISSSLKRRICEMIIAFSGGLTALFEPGLDRAMICELADGLHNTHGGIRAVFSPEGEGFAFAICGEEDKLGDFFAEMKLQLAVRGGGRGAMVQGSVLATEEEINGFFNKYFAR